MSFEVQCWIRICIETDGNLNKLQDSQNFVKNLEKLICVCNLYL
jgi:hypothetical protein